MSVTVPQKKSEAGSRLVLVLQSEQAFWFRWQGCVLLDSFVETVRQDGIASQIRCPWVHGDTNEKLTRVELVLDTTMDELDRVRAGAELPGYLRALQRHRLIRRLKRDYPKSGVHELPGYMSPDVVSVLHHVIPQLWENWLLELQKLEVQVTHIATATELFLQDSARFSSPVLYVVPVGDDHRHLLVDKRTPLFMRVLSAELVQELSEEGTPEIDEYAIAHQKEPESVDDAYCLATSGNAVQQTLEYVSNTFLLSEISLVVVTPVLRLPSPSLEFSTARTLSALSAGCSVEHDLQKWENGKLSGVLKHEGSASCGYDKGLRSRFQQIKNWLFSVLGRKNAGRRPKPRWRVLRHPFVNADVLEPSLAKARFQSRIDYLRKAMLLCTVMATVTLGIAMVHGVNSARQRAGLAGERKILDQQIGKLNDAVLALNQSPESVARSINRIQQYHRIEPLGPQEVLATVATAITDFPSLVLNNLSWSVLEDASGLDTTYSTSDNVPGREMLWTADTTSTQIQIELYGTVLNKHDLRQQQHTLESFVAYLEAVPGIKRVLVLESPVNIARSSEQVIGGHVSYRVSLVLGAS